MDQVTRLHECQARLYAGGTYDLLYRIYAAMWYSAYISDGDKDVHAAKNEWVATITDYGSDVYESLAFIVRDHGYFHGQPVRLYHEHYNVFDRVVKFLLGDETWDKMPVEVHKLCEANAKKLLIAHMNVCFEKSSVSNVDG